MCRQSLSLILVAVVLLAVEAVSQEIVIEPTNGRAHTTSRVSRPAPEPSAPAEVRNSATKSREKSADQERAKNHAKKARAEQIAAKRESTPVGAKPSATPEVLKSDAAEATPTPKKAVETRPAWAMADTRDSQSLQTEIASALARDPILAGSSIQVSVDNDSVTLKGRAVGDQQHLEAQRLAHSYAWNRKLVDQIDVPVSISAQK